MSATSLPRKRGEHMATPKRVWLYGRIDRGATSQVLDCQMEYLRCWAKEQGWVITGETREIRSGVFPDRPGLREVTQAAAEGRIDTVVRKEYEPAMPQQPGRLYVYEASTGARCWPGLHKGSSHADHPRPFACSKKMRMVIQHFQNTVSPFALVRVVGLEPTSLAALEPKSSMFTNFIIPAYISGRTFSRCLYSKFFH